MRLQAVKRGHRWKERMILGIVRRTMGEATDVQRVLFHRPELLGRPLGVITHHAMRLPGDWSIAERGAVRGAALEPEPVRLLRRVSRRVREPGRRPRGSGADPS